MSESNVDIPKRNFLKKLAVVVTAPFIGAGVAVVADKVPTAAQQAANFLNQGIAPEMDQSGYSAIKKAQEQNAALERRANYKPEVSAEEKQIEDQIRQQNAANPDMVKMTPVPTSTPNKH